jgi:sec-independent protein translocase protein TatA
MLSGLRGYEWLILLLIVVLLFGAKRLPDTARGLGRSLRILKAETKGLRDDDDDEAAASTVSSVRVTPVEPRSLQNPQAAPAPTVAQPVQHQPAAPAPTGQDAIER